MCFIRNGSLVQIIKIQTSKIGCESVLESLQKVNREEEGLLLCETTVKSDNLNLPLMKWSVECSCTTSDLGYKNYNLVELNSNLLACCKI